MARQEIREADLSGLGALLSRCAEGNHAAFEQLYTATRGKVFSTALLILKRRDLAEEVMQEAYVRIWTRASSFDPALGSPIAWIAAITRNLAINIVRRPQLETQAADALLLIGAVADVAVVGEDRPNVAVELDPGRERRVGGGQAGGDGQGREE